MKTPDISPVHDTSAISRMPDWVIAAPARSTSEAAFRSGAALAYLYSAGCAANVPQALWRDRLALKAAEVSANIAGRHEGEIALRDTVHLLRSNDHPGPAGEILRQWSRAVARPASIPHLEAVLAGFPVARIAACFKAADGNPVDLAAGVIQAVLTETPRAHTAAMILADAVIAKALGWDHIVPTLAIALKPRDLRLREDALRMACHQAILQGAVKATALATDLARRAVRLRDAVPKLRAKGAERAVDVFLRTDALAPAALLSFMSDRAARRLCDRLVSLGVVRELTGRDTFRLYGV